MKASELMIGDWVNLSKGNWSKNRQVGLIDIEMISESVYLADPIPLTPEILEKNGFENTSVIIVGTPKMRWVSEDERTEITIWIDGTTPMEIRKNVYYEDEESYTLPSPVYVHELQNVLRLCGIEKEITI